MRSYIKNIISILSQTERKKLGLYIFLDIIISIADTAFLAFLLFVVHFYIQPEGTTRYNFLPSWLHDNDSLFLVSSLVILFSIKNLAGFLIYRAECKFIGHVATRLSQAKLLQYLDGKFEDYVNTDSSVHIRRICFQPFEFCQYILSGILQIFTQLFLITLTIIAILLFNAKLFLLLICILLPPVVIVFYFIKKRLTATKLQMQSSNERSFQYVLDALKGYVEGNIYNRTDFFLQRFITHRRRFSKYLFDSLSMQNMPSRVIEIFAVTGLFMLIVIAKWSGNNNSSAFIIIGAFMAAAYKIIPGIVKVINLTGQIKAYEISVEDLSWVGHERKTINEKSRADAIDSIIFRDISFYHAELPVLNNFDLSISKGELVGISGRSGRGKTTILNLLLGFLAPQKGQILVNGIVMENESLKKYWPLISYVRQQPFLIHDTILKNITLDETGYDMDKLEFALKISGLDDFISSLPEKLEKVITENGKNISGGQQQRIALARALYKDAVVILLDEPFNELDEASEIILLEHFRKLAETGRLVIMITHDTRSLSYCHKIISLNEQ
ncbi:MAG: ABC transporter ATP-binding protein [Chitinophagaceae bacterium]|nr:ABC transporter ATP-binding protein [Chitinophagaceae bacterium]